jgi:hypothetical protein
MNEKNSYPLSWPQGWKRHTKHGNPNFSRRSVEVAVTEILRQFKLMGVRDYQLIISTNLQLRQDGYPKSNQPNPSDPGVAVYFKLNGQDRVMATNKWYRVEDNLWAIAKHVDAMRAQARWGVGDISQAFAGYTALMSGAEKKDWRTVFGASSSTPVSVITDTFRDLARRAHPDNGGSHERMAEINQAMADFRKERDAGK